MDFDNYLDQKGPTRVSHHLRSANKMECNDEGGSTDFEVNSSSADSLSEMRADSLNTSFASSSKSSEHSFSFENEILFTRKRSATFSLDHRTVSTICNGSNPLDWLADLADAEQAAAQSLSQLGRSSLESSCSFLSSSSSSSSYNPYMGNILNINTHVPNYSTNNASCYDGEEEEDDEDEDDEDESGGSNTPMGENKLDLWDLSHLVGPMVMGQRPRSCSMSVLESFVPTGQQGYAGLREDLNSDQNKQNYVGIYSPQRRKLRIQRFWLKRQYRMWHKKVKYDVRKNFADSRVRVKGRFVKKTEALDPVETASGSGS